MPGRNSQVARIYAILTILEGAPQGLTVPEIQSRLESRGHEAGRRTIYRDIEALEAAGFPLQEHSDESAGTAARWKLERHTTVNQHLILNTRELVALYLAKGVLTPLTGTPFYEDLTSVFNKIEEKLGERSRAHLQEIANDMQFQPGPRWGLGLDPDVLETVRACCAERQVLRVHYSSASSGKKSTRRLGPHFLYFAQGSMYVVAEDLEDNQIKVFGCARMKDAHMLDEQYAGSIVDPAEYFAHTFGVYQDDKPVRVTIQFSSEIAPFVKERRWHESQRVVTKADDTIVMTLETSLTPELIQWVLGFGARAKVVEPESLKKHIADEAEKLLAVYPKKPAA